MGGTYENPAISVKGLRRRFGDIVALDGIDLDIPRGRTFGLLGPNGAGKSTLMNIISTYLPADDGEIKVDGVDVARQAQSVRRLLGVIPQELSLYDELNARENIEFFGGLYGIDPRTLIKRASHEGLPGDLLRPEPTF